MAAKFKDIKDFRWISGGNPRISDDNQWISSVYGGYPVVLQWLSGGYPVDIRQKENEAVEVASRGGILYYPGNTSEVDLPE